MRIHCEFKNSQSNVVNRILNQKNAGREFFKILDWRLFHRNLSLSARCGYMISRNALLRLKYLRQVFYENVLYFLRGGVRAPRS